MRTQLSERTSNPSEPVEWKVVATVAAVIVVLEIVARIIAPHLDYDRTLIHAFPETIRKIEDSERPRILIYGNSLAMHGVDASQLADELAESTAAPSSVTKITPVGTAVRDWIYLYDTYFIEQEIHPDIVIIGFVAHHLPDHGELKMRRLARHFCSAKNLWACLRDEGNNSQDRFIGVLSHVSAIYGDQQELQWSTMHAIASEYGTGVRKINHFLDAKAAQAAKNSSATPNVKTYRQLARLIGMFNQHNVRTYFVPMPQPELWDLDPNMVQTITTSGATLIDARAIVGLTEQDFSDGYHLGETGTEKFTQFLARVLAEDLRGQ